jgi:hypothetical protein
VSVVSLADAKAFLNQTTSTNDDEVQMFLDRAERILARRVGPLGTETVTDEVHTGPGPLVLRRYPVVGVTSATSYGATVTDLDLDTDAGVLYGTFGSTSRAVRVTYTAGRESLPEDLELAVLELVKHLWESQRGNSAATPPGSYPGEDVQPAAGYLLPYRVQSLIEPFLSPAVA